MVPQRILQAIREVAFLLLVLLAVPTVARAQSSQAESPSAGTSQPAAILDLRAGDAATRRPSRQAFAEALAAVPDFHLLDDEELLAILARDAFSPSLQQGRGALSEAILSYGALDCASTVEHARAATLSFAAAQASGIDARPDLRQALLYQFLCADKDAKVDEAMAATRRLRALGIEGRPAEISQATWQKYPELDAFSNRLTVPLEIRSDVTGAEVWIDFKKVGPAPASVLVPEGPHIVAVAKGPRALASITIASADEPTTTIPLPKAVSSWKGVANKVDDLRGALGQERQELMRDVLSALQLRAAFVMREPGKVNVWILPENRRNAELVGAGPNARIAAKLAVDRLAELGSGPGLDPDMPLLREDPGDTRKASHSRRWWIYAAVLGAAVITGGAIVANDLSEDRQRIEVTLP